MRLIAVWAAALGLPVVLAAQPSSTTIALVGARIIDGTGAAPVTNATLLLNNGRIERIGPSGSIQIPASAARIDVAGKTVIPGLINAHGHLNNGDRSLPVYEQILQQLRTYARFGVTTVYALGDDGKESVRVRDENDLMPLDRARLFASGPSTVARTVEDARRLVAERQAQGVRFIKTRLNGNANDMPGDVYTALIDEAHQRNIRVASHVFNLADAKGLVGAGLDVIAHSIRDRDVDAAFIAELKKRGVGYIPTLTRDLSVFQYTSTPDYIDDPFFLRGQPLYAAQIARVKDPALHAKTQASPGAQAARRGLEQALRNLKLLSEAGVTVAAGTDSGTGTGRWQGYFEHVELELMVKAGMTPMQVLVAATGNAARVMRIDSALGTLQPGKRGDFIVLTADPLADITNTRRIESVWIDGRRVN